VCGYSGLLAIWWLRGLPYTEAQRKYPDQITERRFRASGAIEVDREDDRFVLAIADLHPRPCCPGHGKSVPGTVN
jgi:hypothetical protein